MATYEIYLCDPAGTRLAVLDEQTVVSLRMTRATNAAGVLQLVTKDSYPFTYLQENGLIEVWRTSDGGVTELLTETRWLIVDYAKALSGGRRTYEVEAWSGSALLRWAIVDYAAGTAQAEKTDQADDMLKAIFDQNRSDGITDATRLAYITAVAVQADAAAAPSKTKAFSRRLLENVFSELAEASAQDATTPTRLYYDVVWDSDAGYWEFRTYTGQRSADRSTGSAVVEFSPANLNLLDPRLEYDYRDEVNRVVCGGQGVEDERMTATAVDATRIGASKQNLREQFVNATYVDANASGAAAALQAQADAALRAGRPRRIFTGTLVDTPACRFGDEWHWGDRVLATFDDVTLTVVVNAVTIDVAGGRETIRAALRDVT